MFSQKGIIAVSPMLGSSDVFSNTFYISSKSVILDVVD